MTQRCFVERITNADHPKRRRQRTLFAVLIRRAAPLDEELDKAWADVIFAGAQMDD